MSAIPEACAELAHELHANWGRLEPCDQHTLEEIGQHVVLPDQVQDWYRVGGPVDFQVPWFVERLELFSPVDLVNAQEGYRFSPDDPNAILPTWNPEWVVIGATSGDPIIATVGRAEILMAVHGVGAWAPIQVAADLPQFLLLLARWLRVWKSFSGRLRDQNSDLLPQVQDQVEQVMLAPLSRAERSAMLQFIG